MRFPGLKDKLSIFSFSGDFSYRALCGLDHEHCGLVLLGLVVEGCEGDSVLVGGVDELRLNGGHSLREPVPNCDELENKNGIMYGIKQDF